MKKLFSVKSITFVFVFLFGFLWLVAQSETASAASVTVAIGVDENTNNASCSLSEALENVNDGATTNTDCSPTGAYGTNDTVNIPSGTITLAANITIIEASVSINGAGMGQTIIDGQVNNSTLYCNCGNTDSLTVRDMTVRNFENAGIGSVGGSLSLERVEIDGDNNNNNTTGVLISNNQAVNSTLTIRDVYVHDLSSSSQPVQGVQSQAGSSGVVDANFDNLTISSLTSTNSASAVLFINGVGFGFSPGSVDASLANVTIDDITSPSDAAIGIGLLSAVNSGSSTSEMLVQNTTIRGVAGTDSSTTQQPSAGIITQGGALGSGDVVNHEVELSNVLVGQSTNDALASNCHSADLTGLFSGIGSFSNAITSNGGNISGDNLCSADFFTDSNDMNNVTSLSSTLATLADNGGYVPTIALLEGSPAIDSGITVAGVNDDARGESRPQGIAFDTGSYEYTPLAAEEDENTEQQDALANTGLPTGTITALSLVVIAIASGQAVLVIRTAEKG